ncbi:lysine--tRNA ligase, partial [Pseudomonas sp. MWU12-2115]|uniref:amino acid--tRNA ligase-related protein n=1 Tax=Pseudomonas sp. MWU12-2115 TaxID=2071713 RepID=UPI000E0248A6
KKYLKRLVVGGLERVFEINRNFRNEGMSTRHNPEFTMIEFYEAYSDYQRMMEMTETIIRECALVSCGTTTVSYQSKEVDLGKPFDRFTIVEAIQHYNPQYTNEQLSDAAWVASEIKRLGGKLPPAPGLGSLQLAL